MVEHIDRQHLTVQVEDVSIALEMAKDMDQVIDYYAERHSENADLIPYYAELWPSATALARYLLQTVKDLAGTFIIELGCGLGLPSLVAARKGARVLATDFHPHNEQFLRRNIQLNNITSIEYLRLNWAAPPKDLQADLIIGSDLLYEERNIAPLVHCADVLCAACGVIILADPGRKHVQNAVLRFRELGFQDVLHVVDEIFIVALHRAAAPSASSGLRT